MRGSELDPNILVWFEGGGDNKVFMLSVDWIFRHSWIVGEIVVSINLN
jgi:hypothetical protein